MELERSLLFYQMVLMCIYNKKRNKKSNNKRKAVEFFSFFTTQYHLNKYFINLLVFIRYANKRTHSLMIAVVDIKGILIVSLNHLKGNRLRLGFHFKMIKFTQNIISFYYLVCLMWGPLGNTFKIIL